MTAPDTSDPTGVPDDARLRRELSALVRSLTDAAPRRSDGLGARLRAHLAQPLEGLPVVTERIDAWDLANLQLALDAALARPGWSAELLGFGGHGQLHGGFGELLANDWYPVGSPAFQRQPVGPSSHRECLIRGVLLVDGPDGRLALLVARNDHMGPVFLELEAIGALDGAATRLVADLRRLMEEHDVFRGQVVTVQTTERGGQELVFLERPSLPADELVLPAGMLERIERHVLAPTRHRAALVASGRHLSRGLLLWGPPGTGKTHTVRYLTGRLAPATVIILSGGALGLAGAFARLARRLAPAVLVLEDVDLVAQERVYGEYGERSVLFDLMQEMDGLRDDADVAFVLTTNRPDALEPALAARPGRIDLAIEIPLPDADGRRRLLELYARGLPLQLAAPDAVVDRTDGVTASFIREVLRKAAILAAEAGSAVVTDTHLRAALDELEHETSALTRALLGTGADAAAGPLPPHRGWLAAPGAMSSTVLGMIELHDEG